MLSCRSVNDSMRSRSWASRTGTHLSIYMVLHMSYNFLRTGIDCGSTERSSGNYGIYDGYALLAWKNTREMDFRYRRVFSSATAFLSLWWRNICGYEIDQLRHGPRVSRTSSLQPTFVLDFLHDGKGLCFLFFLSHYLARPFKSDQTGWLDFLSLSHPKDSGVLFTFDDTLVFNDCITGWVNIPRMGLGGLSNQSPGLGTVKRFLFLFLSLWSNWTVPLVAIKRGWDGFEIDQHKDFPYLRLRRKNWHSLHFDLCFLTLEVRQIVVDNFRNGSL